MSAGFLITTVFWVVYTLRKHFGPKVAAGIKAETYNVNVGKNPHTVQLHVRRLNLWTAAKWALRVAGWAENLIAALMIVWLVYLFGAIITGTVVVLGYPV